jgi:hypothetical protein
MSRTRHYGICRAADRAKINKALDRLGHGPKNFNMPWVGENSLETARPTAYTCNWDIDDDDLEAIKAAAPLAKFMELGTSLAIREDKVRPMKTRVDEAMDGEPYKPRREAD